MSCVGVCVCVCRVWHMWGVCVCVILMICVMCVWYVYREQGQKAA